MSKIRNLTVGALLAGAVLAMSAERAAAQEQFGDTVMFDRAPTLDELNALFAKQTTPEKARAVRRINIGAPPPVEPPPVTRASAPAAKAPAAVASAAPPVPARSGPAPKKLGVRIEFALDSAEIDPAYAGHLDGVADFLKKNQDIVVTVAGHADASGDAVHNADLSKRRAQGVRAYLAMGHGIDEGRVKAVGYGEAEPLPGLPSADPRNRRVEFEFN